MLTNGKALETEAEHLTHLTQMTEEFVAKQLPVIRALKVVEVPSVLTMRKLKQRWPQWLSHP